MDRLQRGKVMMRRAFATMTFLGLAACGPAPEPEIFNPPVPEQAGGAPLLNREPDTCGLAQVMYLQGQPGTAVATAGLTKPSRTIPLGGIVTQEYNPERINFYLDADGLIGRISCG